MNYSKDGITVAAIFDAAIFDAGPGVDTMSKAKTRLDVSVQNFHRALYEALESVTDWNDQHIIYEEIKRLVDNDRMFGDEFRGDNYDRIIRSAPGGIDGFRVIQYVPALKAACSWYGDGRYRLCGFRRWYERYVLGLPATRSGVRLGMSVPAVSPASVFACPAHSEPLRAANAGRSLEDFLLAEDKQALIDRIGTVIAGATPKQVATIVRALSEMGAVRVGTGQYADLFKALKTKHGPRDIVRYITGDRAKNITQGDIENMKNTLILP